MKRKLVGSGKVIREDLTARRLEILRKCIANFHLKNVWPFNGAICVNTAQGKRRNTRMCEVNSLPLNGAQP